MIQSYECFTCQKVSVFSGSEDQTKCPTCGGTSIRLLSSGDVKKGLEAGVYHHIDPRTGKPKKKEP